MLLSDIKLPTREEAENLVNTISGEAEYLFDGWGSKFKLQDFNETTPGTYYPSEGYLGFKSVTLPAPTPAPISLQNKTAVSNGVYTADEGYDGLGSVTVSVPIALQDKTITENGLYSADAGFTGLGIVTVNVPDPNLQEKEVEVEGITEEIIINCDDGFDGLSKVILKPVV